MEERVDVPLCKEQKIFIMRTLTKEEQLVRYVQAIEDNAVDWMTG